MTAALHVQKLVEFLLQRDARGAAQLLTGLVSAGIAVERVLNEVIGPAQVEIGERWHRNEISVADEHGATAVVDSVLSVLTLRTDDSPFEHFDRSVAVVCAVGEWHTMPARLLAETLRGSGATVEFLGPSMPPSHLARFLTQHPQDLVAVSCSTALTLDGVLSCVHVAHDAGIPVLAGGRGLGQDDGRATVLGADLWAASTEDAVRLAGESLPRELLEPTADIDGAAELSLQRDAIVADAMEKLQQRFPAMERFDAHQRARTQEDFGYIVRFAEGAVLARDDSVFFGFLPWLDQLLVSLGLPPETLRISIDALADTGRSERLGQLIARARERGVI